MDKKVLEFLDELLPKRMLDGSMESIVNDIELSQVDYEYVGAMVFALWFRDHKTEVAEAAGKERMEMLCSKVNMYETDMLRYTYALKSGKVMDIYGAARRIYEIHCEMMDMLHELCVVHAMEVPSYEDLRVEYYHLVPVLV